jgi:peptide deformylase
MTKTILKIGDPRLGRTSLPVAAVTDEIKKLAADMIDTMYESQGIGLAAIQIGEEKRMFVVDIPEFTEGAMTFINPELVGLSAEKAPFEEGCLSIPGVRTRVLRSKGLTIRYTDLEGKKKELGVEGLYAICLQHEYDHLDGILFVERAVEDAPRKRIQTINDMLEEKNLPRFLDERAKPKKGKGGYRS